MTLSKMEENREYVTEFVEPHPMLMQYIADAQGLFVDFDGGRREFIDHDEWHYVPSELEQNIFLLRRLGERGLTKENNKVFDCGIGLATTMYDLYLQSQEIEDKTFEFSGVEKHERYTEYLKEKLLHYWEGNLTLIEGEIMDQDYSGYDIVYTYSPFKTEEKLMNFYNKIVSEVSTGSVIVESRNCGKGFKDTLTKVQGLEEIEVDDIVVYRKIN
jgi:hypothetical protein